MNDNQASFVKFENDLFLRACKKLSVERTPVWICAEAGRYLPEYRAVREKTDFITMCHTPELAALVTIQPVDIINVDAAIIFSDILVIPEAMGMHFEMLESRGPVFHRPLRNDEDASTLKEIDPERFKIRTGCSNIDKKSIERESAAYRF